MTDNLESYEIAVVGLGPAGSTVARLVGRQYKTIAIDKKSSTDDSFRKPCGGLLAPDAQKALSRLNLALPKSVLVDPQIFAVKTIDLKRDIIRHYQRFYINLDRQRFDLWLQSLIPDQVNVRNDARCTEIVATADGFEITYSEDKTEHKIHARFVIGADGANSLVRRSLFADRPIKKYTAIQQWFAETEQVHFYSCFFDSDVTDSYCWSVSKDGYFLVGGAFPIKHSQQHFELLKQKLAKWGFCFDQPFKSEACLVSMPRGIRDFCVARNNAFLIGEAAGFISPTSLEGISYALNSAYHLATVLNSNASNPTWQFRLKTLPMRLKLLMKHFKAPFMYKPFLRNLIMKTGIKSINVIK